ncbi:MAG: carboxypeptidase regulatory-like domain-containing protein [Planctomycetes bacterium]|nr:carboxypeptidase regulatory-like domain-containing protein [Planctomycetota bacterium]
MRVSAALAIVLSSVSLTHVAVAQNPTREVHGRVIDRDGKPVAGCAVTIVESGDHPDTTGLLQAPPHTTDAQGHYRLTIPRDVASVVVVAAKDHQVCAYTIVPSPNGIDASTRVQDALLLTGTTLHGRVRDAAGEPIAGARVLVEDPAARNRTSSWRLESLAISDERGYVHVPGVPKTGMLATIDAPGFAVTSQFVGHGAPFDVTLEATGFVRGRVVDHDGAPVAGARMYVGGKITRITRSDADGRFELTAPKAWRFQVTASLPLPNLRNFASEQLSGPTEDVTVGPRQGNRSPQNLTVRCVDDANGEAIASFRLSHYPSNRSDPPTLLLAHARSAAEHHEQATLEIPCDANGRMSGSLIVDAPGHGFVIVSLDEPREEALVVRLPAQCVLTGTVTDAATGKPAAGCRVRALPYASNLSNGTDPGLGSVVTDAAGRYRIERLADGEYGVQAYGAAHQGSPCQRVTIAPEQQASLDITLPEARVVDLELVGEVPPRCLATISWRTFLRTVGETQMTYISHGVMPPPLPLSGPRKLRLDRWATACSRRCCTCRRATASATASTSSSAN